MQSRNRVHNNIMYGNNTGTLIARAMRSKAVMFLMEPRKFDKQVSRATMIRPTSSYVNRAQSVVNRSVSDNSAVAAISALAADPETVNIISPETYGTTINIGHINERWNFMLRVENDVNPDRIRIGGTGFNAQQSVSLASNNIVLYWGMVLDEPFTNFRNGVGNIDNPVFNPHARVLITHKTIVAGTKSFGASGPNIEMNVTADVDFVPGAVLGNLASAVMHQNTPDALLTSIITDGDDQPMSILGDRTNIKNINEPIAIPTSLNSPITYMARVLSASANANRAVLSNKFRGSMGIYHPDQEESIKDMTINNLTYSDSSSLVGFRPNDTVTFDVITQRYNPDVQVIKYNTSSFMSEYNQEEASIKNMFQAQIAQVGPVICSNAGIAELSFRYDSYLSAPSATNPQGIKSIEIYNAAPLWNMSDEDFRIRINVAINDIVDTICAAIVSQQGHIDLHVVFASGGITRVVLNLYDHMNMRSDVPFTVPTIHSALLTPNVGSADVVNSNGLALSSLVDVLSGNTSSYSMPENTNEPLNIPRISADRPITNYAPAVKPSGRYGQPNYGNVSSGRYS